MISLDDEKLRKFCSNSVESLNPHQARAIVDELGVPFARYCGSQRFRELLVECGESQSTWLDPIPLSRAPGTCNVAFVGDEFQRYPLLAKGFVVPFYWVARSQHDSRLPASILSIATKAENSIRSAGSEEGESWGLALHPEFLDEYQYDLSQLTCISFDSAWASLVAGLWTAIHQSPVDPEVLVTAQWDNGHMQVGGIPDKLQAATRHRIERVFLAPSNMDEAKEWNLQNGEPLELIPLVVHANSLKSLGPVLCAMDVRPPSNSSHEVRVEYYRRLLRYDDDKAEGYYREELFAEIVLRCRTQICERVTQLAVSYSSSPTRKFQPGPISTDSALSSPLQIKQLVTVASKSPNLVLLGVALFQPEELLLIHTQDADGEDLMRDVQQRLSGEPIRVQAAPFEIDSPTMQEDLKHRILSFLGYGQADQMIVDLTPGKKLMSLVIAESVPTSAWNFLIDSSQMANSKVARPFTEKVHLWQKR